MVFQISMSIVKTLFSIIAIPLSVLMFVYAGIDDSPGGQLLGVIVGISGIVGIIKIIKEAKKDKSQDSNN